MPTGGGVSAGPFHSQNLESLFMHIPGLKIVYPSCPYDAKGLLASSINDPNPILFFEHKLLYRTQKTNVPKKEYTLEIGKGRIIQQGEDLTVVTYGLSTIWLKEMLEELKEQNISIELIDLRSLMPWDKSLVYDSIMKTNKVLIVHEANQTGGVGAEISASISNDLFEYLDAPVERLGSIDIPGIPSFLEPMFHNSVKNLMMIFVGASIDAMVATFRNVGVFKSKYIDGQSTDKNLVDELLDDISRIVRK